MAQQRVLLQMSTRQGDTQLMYRIAHRKGISGASEELGYLDLPDLCFPGVFNPFFKEEWDNF